MSIIVKESRVLFLATQVLKIDPGNPLVKEALALLANVSQNAAIADRAKQLKTKVKNG